MTAWDHDIMFEVYTNSSGTEEIRMVHRPTGLSITRKVKNWHRFSQWMQMSETLKAKVEWGEKAQEALDLLKESWDKTEADHGKV